MKIVLNGNDLNVGDIAKVISDPELKIELASSALIAVKKSFDFLNAEMDGKILYGINTGFGPMASHIISKSQLHELQLNLIRSHAVGMGEPIKHEYVLAAMIVRLNTLVKGYSGVSIKLVEHLQEFINKRIIPVVPEHGAVGTSGDLVQLAHIALALIGEGEVYYKNNRRKTKEVLTELNIQPYILQPKEGLALINGTSMMSGIGAVLCVEAQNLLNVSVKNGAFALELIHAFNDGISEKLHSLRPHKGQIEIAKTINSLLSSSTLLRGREVLHAEAEDNDDVNEIPHAVQEVYSFRCIPQILGPIFDTLENYKKILEIEINSVTDNPVIDPKNKDFIHGGNFHGDYISSAVDQLKMTLVKLTMLSERRINFFLNRNINKFFPPFLNLKKPGITLGLQGLQFVATSTTAQNQTFAYPHYVHSIPTNGDNQDIVSMGTDSSLILAKVIENAFVVLTIETIALSQALDYTNEQDKVSDSSKELYDGLRAIFPKIVEDRVIGEELEKAVIFIKNI